MDQTIPVDGTLSIKLDSLPAGTYKLNIKPHFASTSVRDLVIRTQASKHKIELTGYKKLKTANEVT